MTIVHIGLGKTASTTLQKYVFPIAASQSSHIFNSPELIELLKRSGGLRLSEAEKTTVSSLLSSDRHFISLESLVNWNPAFWRWSAERNLEIFGPGATILITLRDPLSWMTSAYQQMVHEGNVLTAEEFFVSEEEYRALEPLDSPARLQYFCSDFFDYRALMTLYRERFRCVKVVEMSQIGSMDFLEDLLGLSAESKAFLKAAFETAPYENRSYSVRAMSLTLKREKLLRRLGLKTLGSNDRRYGDFCRAHTSGLTGPASLPHPNLLKRYLLRLTEWRLPTWRGLMQVGVDRILPYEKFFIPKEVYINQGLVDRNRAFISELRERAQTG